MGLFYQLLLPRRDIANMLHLFLLPAFALAAPAADPLYSLGVGVAHTHVQPVTRCQTISEVAVQQSCHLEKSEVCHTEYDTVVETSHVSECSDVVTQECTQTSSHEERSRSRCRCRCPYRHHWLRRLLSRGCNRCRCCSNHRHRHSCRCCCHSFCR